MNTMMSDRGMMTGMPAMGMMMPMSMMGGTMPMGSMMPGMMGSAATGSMGGMMVPRCMMKMEKCAGGMRMICTCEERTAAEMLKNLCMMTQGGMCSCCMMMNGMCCCCCNLGMMGMCTMEMAEMGCTMTCTSGDKMMEKMIQSCCDMMNAMMMPGCSCCMMMNGMPICCCMC